MQDSRHDNDAAAAALLDHLPPVRQPLPRADRHRPVDRTQGHLPDAGEVTARPGTMGRNFRIPDDLYADAKRIAAARNETLTHVITEALRRYVKRNMSDLPAKEQP